MKKGNDSKSKDPANGSGLNFEAQLWAAADKMRGHMDASEYKHERWGGENLRQDVRWKFRMPPVNNANYAWIQYFIHHLSPVGVAGFVMANGSMSTQTGSEGELYAKA